MHLLGGHHPIGRATPAEHEQRARPDYRYDHADWLDATSFDWIEQPLSAVADAFFDFITHHHDPVRQRRGPSAR